MTTRSTTFLKGNKMFMVAALAVMTLSLFISVLTSASLVVYFGMAFCSVILMVFAITTLAESK